MNPDEKQIEIRIKGDNKREALVVIRHYLDQINSDIKKIRISQEVPCNCSENCPQRYSYEKLREAERINVEDFRCIQSFKQISISSLLDGYKEREERLKERDEIYGKPIVIINQPQAHSETHSTVKAEQRTNINVDVNIDLNIDLPQIQTEFDNLKDELEDLDPKIDSYLDKIQDSLDELSPNSDREKVVKPLNKLNRFLVKLSDPDSNYNKVITGTEKGIEYAQKLGRTYNKFAQWLAMPTVPELFLGK
jgi:internalin A